MSQYNKCPLCYIDITDNNYTKLPYCTCPMQIHPECYDILADNNFKCPSCYSNQYFTQFEQKILDCIHNSWSTVMRIADKILENPTYYTIPLYITYIIIATLLLAIPTIMFCWSRIIMRSSFNVYEKFVLGICAPIVIPPCFIIYFILISI
jgi:hypothetical protein